jgi:hypothetical protein
MEVPQNKGDEKFYLSLRVVSDTSKPPQLSSSSSFAGLVFSNFADLDHVFDPNLNSNSDIMREYQTDLNLDSSLILSVITTDPDPHTLPSSAKETLLLMKT